MILIFFFREKISRFGKKEEMYHFLKFLLEIFATLKSFQLIDSFIPWLAQQETKFLHGWSNVSCARSGERGSLPCRVEIYTPNKEEDEWGGNRSKEVSLFPEENRTQFSFSVRGTVALISHLPRCLSFFLPLPPKLIEVSIYLTRLPLFKHHRTGKD